VIEWERRLEVEEERQKVRRSEPYVNYLAAPPPCQKERKSIFAQIFQPRQESQAFTGDVNALKF
jgi:hypothetical protein